MSFWYSELIQRIALMRDMYTIRVRIFLSLVSNDQQIADLIESHNPKIIVLFMSCTTQVC